MPRSRRWSSVWLPFAAEWEGDGRSFVWRARAGWGPAKALHVVDRYGGGGGSMDVRLLGRVPLVHADDNDTVRSAAGRAAVEAATWAPAALLPDRGVTWRVESEQLIVASWDMPPERPEVRLRIDERGAVRSCSVLRWDKGEQGVRGYIPCGGDVHAEARFGDVVIPSRLTIGWWFETPRWFKVEIVSVQPLA